MTQLPTLYQQFIHKSRYARWLPEENRREDWHETVARYFDFFEVKLKENCNYDLPKELRQELEEAVLNLEIMPSMRALMTAGPALDRCNVAGYNCSYIPIDSPRAFDEILYILMCGTGVGFSVERRNVEQMPIVNEHFEYSKSKIVVEDSKSGWAKAFRELVAMLYAGQVPEWDLSKLRPAGARLKTFGGRSSGPEPLGKLFKFTTDTFKRAAGRRLSPLECHDIACMIGDVVVVGGVRRSALISLSDLSDVQLRDAKAGEWWNTAKHRALANNSAVYNGKPDILTFMTEWQALIASNSGERGIYNREASYNICRKIGKRDPDYAWGTNPCSEIILRPYQFCNLTEVVVRAEDDITSLKRKVRLAAILGTFQSTLTNFKYLRKIWQKNTEEERLLGVSLTGILDNVEFRKGNEDYLNELKKTANEANAQFAEMLNIPSSAAITCVKPSGTVSQLVNAASGIHSRHSDYYIRTVRGDIKDPLTQFLIDKGIPAEQDVMTASNMVFSFPVKSPENCVTREDLTAVEHLNIWLNFQRHWCEHKPSITISVRTDEWMEVGAWVYKHFDEVSGISFLPYSEHTYQQAPYQECTAEEYEKLAATMPAEINWHDLEQYEKEDTTTGNQELACTGGVCEIVDITK